ncbi:MAG: endolytic transglycosylase MltG [Bacillota bacterium]
MKKIILSIFLIISLITTACSLDDFKKPVDANSDEKIKVEVPKGASTNTISEILDEKNLIKSQFFFKREVKNLGYDGKLKAGEYRLSKSFDLNKIINHLYKGLTYEETVKFTVPEGLELQEIVDLLIKENIINDGEKFKEELEKQLKENKLTKNIDYVNLEGYLFPDTYIVNKDASIKQIVSKFLNRFNKVFDEETISKIEESKFSFYEILTLASIIEREVAVDNERNTVASVFYNRIDKGMYLQSCATVQYILGERKANLLTSDTKIDDPYNTYQYEGLPPGPICSPGEKAIKAAVNPKDTDYLFFVKSYENDGSHIFTTNLNDHNYYKNKLKERK